MGSDRSLLAIAGGIAAIVVVAVGIVVLLGDRPPASFPPDSPEAAVQGYLAAWQDEELEAAYAYFSDDVRSHLPFEQFRQAARDQGGLDFPGGPERRRVTIDRVELEGDRAEVYLSIEYSFDGGIFGGGYRDSRDIHLVREDGAWKIDDALLGLEPGPFFPPDFDA